jgi:hypothetical protein
VKLARQVTMHSLSFLPHRGVALIQRSLARRRSDRAGRVLRLFAAAFALLFAASYAMCQISTGAINGTVTDSTGAVIEGATVTITNTATNVQRSTQTTNRGSYSLAEVPPGTYNLQVGQSEFQTVNQTGIKLTVNQTLTFNETLKPGSTTQTVTVAADAAVIDTSTAANGTAIENTSVQALPLNGRNFTQLLTLTPGAVEVNVDQNASNSSNSFLGTRIGTVVFPAINGQGNRSNLFSVDGLIDQGVMGSNYAVAPILDDIQEFKVQSLNDESMFGGVTGGVINIVTKSGTNDFHGTAWEFLRNSAFDARNPFMSSVTALHQNQFGANLGGPVILPRYNGRNKVFFFGSYEQYHRTLGGENLYSVPTAAELAGDLSDQSKKIYNPFSTRVNPDNSAEYIRDVFPNNQIPSNLIDQTMVKLASMFPEPVNTGVAGYNGLDTTPTKTDQYSGNGRINAQFDANNSGWFRYSRYELPITAPGGFKGLVEPIRDYGWNFGGSFLHTFNPTTLIQFQFGRTYDVALSGSSFTNKPSNFISGSGMASSFVCGFLHSGCLVPTIIMSSFLTGGETYDSDGQSDFYQYSADFTKIVRGHTLKLGYALLPNKFDAVKAYNFLGFSTPQTADPLNSGTTGNELASFLLGVPDNATYRNSSEAVRNLTVMSIYGEDQWKVTPRLTLNAGIRYDVTYLPPFGLESDKSNAVGTLDLTNGTYVLQANPGECTTSQKAPCIPGGLPQTNVVVSTNGKLLQSSTDNIQPRLGLAYALNDKTAIHVGGGVYYDNWSNFMQNVQNLAGTWPQVQLLSASNLNTNYVTTSAEDPLPSVGSTPADSPFTLQNLYVDPHMKNTRAVQWIFGFERQLTSDTTLTVNYVGNKDSRIEIFKAGNVAMTPGPGDISSRTPFPYIAHTQYYESSVGKSDYHALQVSLKRSYTKGFSYLVSYTWSKDIDVGSPQNPYDMRDARSVASIDLPHVLTASALYDLPFGSNRRFRTPSNIVNQVIGNWQINAIATLHSGLPFTLVTSGDIANTGNTSGSERLNKIGDLSLPNRSVSEWFNTSAVAVPEQYTFGNIGRNSLRSQAFRNADLSVFRSFPIRREKSLEFRAEMFNATNTPTWGKPGYNISSAHFGQVTSTYSTSRQIQLALKLHY